MTERRPATEAGREYIAAVSADTWSKEGRVQWAREFVLAIEAQATDARVAALTEALRQVSFGHRLVPRCKTLMPTDADCDCGYRDLTRLLADLPAAAAERPLDVELLARALYVIWPNDPTWFAEPPWYREKAQSIAAEYARLSESDR